MKPIYINESDVFNPEAKFNDITIDDLALLFKDCIDGIGKKFAFNEDAKEFKPIRKFLWCCS